MTSTPASTNSVAPRRGRPFRVAERAKERLEAAELLGEPTATLAEELEAALGSRSLPREQADALRSGTPDVDAIAARGLRYERLDQLLTEHVMGVR